MPAPRLAGMRPAQSLAAGQFKFFVRNTLAKTQTDPLYNPLPKTSMR